MMLLRYILLVFALLLLGGCSVNNSPARSYVILSGEHFSRPYFNPSKVEGTELKAKVWVSASCNIFVPSNPEQVNKILGISTRAIVKNNNSAILGWSTSKDSILDYWMFVNYGNRFEQLHFGTGQPEKWQELKIWATETDYHMSFNGLTHIMPRNGSSDNFWLVEPYFGGISPNPSETECTIRVEFL